MSYDAFAWFYDRYWAAPAERWQIAALERLLLIRIPEHARILELCCGTGNLAAHLIRLGYGVVGVDASREMLRLARGKAPDGVFLQAEATAFALADPADAGVCLFDSLNHLLTPDDLRRAFRNVAASLKPGAPFIFDVNTSEAYGERWDQTFGEVQDDHALFLRGRFDRATRIGTTEITMFRRTEEGAWQRSDTSMRQRPWEVSEIEPLLQSEGFTAISFKRAAEDLGIGDHYGTGRVFVAACTQLKKPDML